MSQPVDSSILHEIVRIIDSRRKVPDKVIVTSKEYLLTYLEDHRRRLEEALMRFDGDRLNMLYGQLASKVKYQLLRRVPGRVEPKPAPKPAAKVAKPAAKPVKKAAARPAVAKKKAAPAKKKPAAAKKPAAIKKKLAAAKKKPAAAKAKPAVRRAAARPKPKKKARR